MKFSWGDALKRARVVLWSYAAKVSLFGVAVTVVSYWISYQDRMAAQQDAAWATLRQIVSYMEYDYTRSGNFGQISAIETLTRDCGRWWRQTPFQSAFEIFFPSCVDLNSVVLTRMELGALKAKGANFSYGNLSCSNLAVANFSSANLQATMLKGTNLAGADLRDADLTKADLRLANLSWARFSQKTKFDIKQLKCACLEAGSQIQGLSTIEMASLDLPRCPSGNRCEPDVMKSWKCEAP